MTGSREKDPHGDLAGVLHDVGNALTVLLGWVGEARAPEATPDAVAYALTIIEQRARIARDLARHAIGSARIDEQREIGAVADEVAKALKVESQRRGAPLVVTGVEVAAKVAGALDVSQVLTNLALNALAFAPAGTSVEITVSADAACCKILVADHGPGVDDDRKESVFRGDARRPGGTGVGLRHSRALAKAWGGDVELLANQVHEDKGARFLVTWPRVDAPDTAPRPPTSTARIPDLDGLRVLVVEDDAAVVQLLETGLDARGAKVTVASSAADLAKALAAGPYEAMLVDLSPIAADAGGALAKLRAGCPGATIVFITGSADALPEALTSAGEDVQLVRKPFEVREVVAALTRKRA